MPEIKKLTYIGKLKDRRVKVAPGRYATFQQGEPVDIQKIGITQGRARQLINTRQFKADSTPAHKHAVTENMEPARYICACGFVAKDESVLTAHRLNCEAALKLNLGCGPDIQEGYINIDVRNLEGAVQADVSDPGQMTAYRGAVEILAYDVLEHFPREQAREALKLWHDLLIDGGTLKIRCPDLHNLYKLAQLPQHGDAWLEFRMFGGQDYLENTHKCGWTEMLLLEALVAAGFSTASSRQTPTGNVEVEAIR